MMICFVLVVFVFIIAFMLQHELASKHTYVNHVRYPKGQIRLTVRVPNALWPWMTHLETWDWTNELGWHRFPDGEPFDIFDRRFDAMLLHAEMDMRYENV